MLLDYLKYVCGRTEVGKLIMTENKTAKYKKGKSDCYALMSYTWMNWCNPTRLISKDVFTENRILEEGKKSISRYHQLSKWRFEWDLEPSMKSIKNVKEEDYWKMRIYNRGHNIMELFWYDINFCDVKTEKEGDY